MNYTIEHIDDIRILYNGKGKHDKIYIVVTCRNDEWPEQWYVKGLYRSRTRAKYNLSEIAQTQSKPFAMISANATVMEKIRKGYEELMDDRQNTYMGFPTTKALLLSELQSMLSNGQPTVEPHLEEYECIDDLGAKGQFIPEMHYMGKTDAQGKLHMVNDNGQSVVVDKDNFRKVPQVVEQSD